MAADYAGAWKLLYEWQTLIAGLLALLAAYVATRPVWRQIRSLQIQSEVMARDTLIMRIAAIESRQKTTWEKIYGITCDFTRRIYPDQDESKPDINLAWADEAEGIVKDLVAALTANQETSLDGELIDTKRRAAIQQARELSDCLSSIHAPYSWDLHDPELNLTEDEIEAAKTAAERAEGDLGQRISAVRKSGVELDAAFKARLEQLRDRIRQIDVVVGRPVG